MKIHEILARDPRIHALANSGQARITGETDDRAISELRAELETFVCDGQYGNAIERMLRSYLDHLDRPRQDAAWVSGFFGSGKSHLLKMLGHLWVDTEFEDGATARTLVHSLPDDLQAVLRELDTRVTQSKVPSVAAAGTLPGGSGDFVKMTILSVILMARRLPQQYPQARFCFWLKEQGFYNSVRNAVESVGKNWLKELNNLYVSGVIAKAVLECDPHFATDEKQSRQTLRAQFPNKAEDISTDEFLEMARAALATDGELPLTILVLDEVQQYIADSTERAVAITEITEAICTQLDSKIMLVASGQSALSATPQLQKLKDRYRINAQLSDADVEAVTRKVLLRKNAAAISAVKSIVDRNAGEIDKHLSGTRLAARSDDSRFIVDDYPLLPTRRRFWEECFRAVDAAGTHSQLRSQLRILHDSLTDIAACDIGTVIRADMLFEAISPNLVQTGVLLNEIDLRIRQLDDGTDIGKLRRRICGLVFLISKLHREGSGDLGVKATARTIADLMVDDVTADSGPFRKQIENELEQLASDGTLMKVGDEYRLQTTEGAEWDGAYREKVGALRQQESDIAYKRDQLLGAAVQKAVGEVKLSHGESKEKRMLQLHTGQMEPDASGDRIVVWLQDGWTVAQKEVESAARRRGSEGHVVHVFLPKKSADDLKMRIIEAEASRFVIELRGVPSSNEGREARESMQSRYVAAQQQLDALIQDVTATARVFQGGGNEVFGDSLIAKLIMAANDSLARLFPRFGDADHKSWGVALRRARDGSDEPLRIVGWDKATEDHPVVRQVLTEIGNGAKGGDVRKTLQASPYGWPRDAVDTALIALHRHGAIRAEQNRQAIAPGHLDQNKISTTDFHPERRRLSTTDKLKLRSLYQELGIAVKSGEEEVKARDFLSALRALAIEAGGDAPLPSPSASTKIDNLEQLVGSEQLAEILASQDELQDRISDWTKARDRKIKRLPVWRKLEQLLHRSVALPIHDEISPEINAIKSDRSLLDDTDHVSPLVTKAANALRLALKEQARKFEEAHGRAIRALEGDASWKNLSEPDRSAILKQVGLASPTPSVLKSDDDVISELEKCSLEARILAVDAVTERMTRALEEGARRLKPEAKRVSLRPATLGDEAAVRGWLQEHEEMLLKAVSKGPVIVG